MRVCDLIDPSTQQWVADLIYGVFSQLEAESIMSIPLSHRLPNDSWMWIHDLKGQYSVKSGYKYL